MDNLKNLNDRRLFYYAEPAAAKISAGKAQSDTAAYVGVDVSMDYAAMNAGHSASKYSLLNKRYLTEAACEPRMLLTYGEQQLILAEARVRGWITTETAQTYYQQGVKSALAAIMATKSTYAHTKPIDQTYIDNYFTGEAAFKTSVDDQLKQIWMQRYFLNFMQDAEYSYLNPEIRDDGSMDGERQDEQSDVQRHWEISPRDYSALLRCGARISYADMSFDDIRGIDDGDYTSYAWQIMTGVEFYVTSEIAVDVGYRYFATEMEFDHEDSDDVTFSTGMVTLGLKMFF